MDCEKKDCIYQPLSVNCVNCGSKHINYQAEIARQSVTDGEIQAAIDIMGKALIYPTTLPDLGGHYFVEAVPSDIKNLILAALRAYKPEPCEWCDLEPSEQIFAYGMAFSRIPVNYCPNCGRPLGGDRK